MHVVQTAVLGTDDLFPCIQTNSGLESPSLFHDSSSYLNAIGAATAAELLGAQECDDRDLLCRTVARRPIAEPPAACPLSRSAGAPSSARSQGIRKRPLCALLLRHVPPGA